MAEPEYKRLTGARLRRTGLIAAVSVRSSLWLGSDHLLSVDATGYTEEYKRFYFRDIQALTICASKRRTTWNWVLGVLLFPFLVALITALFSRSGIGAVIAWAVFVVVFGTPLVVNNILGPTCKSYLRTAVQTEELPSLGRLRRARKVINRLRPLVAAAQGQLAPEEISARMLELSQLQPSMFATGVAPQTTAADDSNIPPRIGA